MNILQNAKKIIQKAKDNKYAIAHININNLEWTKAALIAANELNAPIIISASTGAIKYMGGYNTVVNLVKNLIIDLDIKVDVALHLDHGSYEACLKAIESGFTSIMFDGSHLPFEENLEKTKELVELAKEKNISLEAEVGTIGGEEDGISSNGELANKDEAKKISQIGIDFLAAGIGNIHGNYPSSWKSLNFDKLQELVNECNIGIVLHGGSGIPEEQIKRAISLGVVKININTELQQAFANSTIDFITSKKVCEGKNYDPRKLLKPGYEKIIEVIKQKIILFGSDNKN